MKLPFTQKRIEMSQHHKHRISTRANRRTKFLPGEWRTTAFHKEVIKLTERKKARMALRESKILSISTRRQVFRTVDEYIAQREALGEKYSSLRLENELTHAEKLFRKQIFDIIPKKSKKFLNVFFNIHA
jgi:hypothetical protein